MSLAFVPEQRILSIDGFCSCCCLSFHLPYFKLMGRCSYSSHSFEVFLFFEVFLLFFFFGLFLFFDWDGICDHLKAVLRSIFKIWMLLLLLSNFVSSYIDDASLIYIVFTWFIFRHKSKKFSIPMDKYRWVSSHCECLFDLPN